MADIYYARTEKKWQNARAVLPLPLPVEFSPNVSFYGFPVEYSSTTDFYFRLIGDGFPTTTQGLSRFGAFGEPEVEAELVVAYSGGIFDNTILYWDDPGEDESRTGFRVDDGFAVLSLEFFSESFDDDKDYFRVEKKNLLYEQMRQLRWLVSLVVADPDPWADRVDADYACLVDEIAGWQQFFVDHCGDLVSRLTDKNGLAVSEVIGSSETLTIGGKASAAGMDAWEYCCKEVLGFVDESDDTKWGFTYSVELDDDGVPKRVRPGSNRVALEDDFAIPELLNEITECISILSSIALPITWALDPAYDGDGNVAVRSGAGFTLAAAVAALATESSSPWEESTGGPYELTQAAAGFYPGGDGTTDGDTELTLVDTVYDTNYLTSWDEPFYKITGGITYLPQNALTNYETHRETLKTIGYEDE